MGYCRLVRVTTFVFSMAVGAVGVKEPHLVALYENHIEPRIQYNSVRKNIYTAKDRLWHAKNFLKYDARVADDISVNAINALFLAKYELKDLQESQGIPHAIECSTEDGLRQAKFELNKVFGQVYEFRSNLEDYDSGRINAWKIAMKYFNSAMACTSAEAEKGELEKSLEELDKNVRAAELRQLMMRRPGQDI
jgi:hypothetical protein